MISPCSGPEDVFMDTFEQASDLQLDNSSKNIILEDIYNKLNKIEELFCDIHNKIANIK
jgi:hypothetical protein